TRILTVSVLLTNANPSITAGKNIPPMLLKGAPQELGGAFFTNVNEPIKQAVKLFINLEAYQAELDKTKKQPEKNTGKTNATTPKKTADNSLFNQPEITTIEEEHEDDLDEQPDESELLAEKQRLYDEAMQRVNQLNADMKYKE